MDGVSAASGIAGLITLALQIGATVGVYVNAVKDHGKNVRELVEEISLLAEVLCQLNKFLHSEQAQGQRFDDDSVLQKAVQDCTHRLERIGDRLRPPKDKFERTMDKLKWPFQQSDVLRMVDNLRRFTHTFQFALSIKGCSLLAKSSSEAKRDLQEMKEEVKKLSEMSAQMGLETAVQESLKRSEQLQDILDILPTLLQSATEVREIGQTVRLAEEREQERRKTDILDWLAPVDGHGKHTEVAQRRTPGSGKWLLEDPRFVTWLQAKTRPHDLLCVGGPGRGKTFLCSLVIDHLRKMYASEDTAIIYYYCDYSEKARQTPMRFAASLLRQLVQRQKNIPTSLAEFYQQTKNEMKDTLWFQELILVLKRVVGTYSKCMVAIDALDETDLKEQRRGFYQVLEALRIANLSVQIFTTTRPHVEIEQQFRDVVRIEISANEEDLRYFLSSRIDTHPHSNDIVDPGLKEELISQLCARAAGMFLLPALQIDSILDQVVTKSDVKREISSISTNLPDVFRSTLHRMANQSAGRKTLAYQALMWVSHAKRPLSIIELRHALAIRFDRNSIDSDDLPSAKVIVDSCCGLVEIVRGSEVVRFAHYSLYEQLRENQHGLFTDGELSITRACLHYLSLKDIGPLSSAHRADFYEAITVDCPLLKYASSFWGHHADNVEVKLYEDLAVRFLDDASALFVTARAREIENPASWRTTDRMQTWASTPGAGISIAASFGLAALTKLLIDRSTRPVSEYRTVWGSTALHEAALRGFRETAEVLLASGALLTDSNDGKATPFYLAVSYGQLEMCEFLLTYGQEQLDYPCKDRLTALHKASDLGNVPMVGFLLASGATVGLLDKFANTPLHLAARRGYNEIAKLLVQEGASVNVRNQKGFTPLDFASTGGYCDVVAFLLDQGAQIENKNTSGWTALHQAARKGHTDVVQILLNNGANLSAQDYNRRTPLSVAVKSGNLETVQALLNFEPSRKLQQLQHHEKSGSDIKTIAFYTNQFAIHKYLRNLENELMDYGPVTHRGPDPLLPLTLAIENGSLAGVKQLLDPAPELLHKVDQLGLNVLHIAFYEQQRHIAMEILARGVSINVKGFHDWTPLHIASSMGSLSMLTLALSYSADPHAVTETLQTALHKAASSRSLPVLIELLRCGCLPSTPNSRGMTAVHVAAHQNFLEGVRELLRPEWNSASPKISLMRDNYGQTARDWAEFTGHLEMADFLRSEERKAKVRPNLLSNSTLAVDPKSKWISALEANTLDVRSGTIVHQDTSSSTATLDTPLVPRHFRNKSAESFLSDEDEAEPTTKPRYPPAVTEQPPWSPEREQEQQYRQLLLEEFESD